MRLLLEHLLTKSGKAQHLHEKNLIDSHLIFC